MRFQRGARKDEVRPWKERKGEDYASNEKNSHSCIHNLILFITNSWISRCEGFEGGGTKKKPSISQKITNLYLKNLVKTWKENIGRNSQIKIFH